MKSFTVQAQRPLPDEVIFNLSESEQDKGINNRYWLKFPPGYTNQNSFDRIVGIRSIKKVKTHRLISYDWAVELVQDDLSSGNTVDLIEGRFEEWLDETHDLQDILNKWNEQWLDTVNYSTRTTTLNSWQHVWTRGEIMNYLRYSRTDNKVYITWGIRPGANPNYFLPTQQGGTEAVICSYKITIKPLTDDTAALLNIPIASSYSEISGMGRLNFISWSRNDILIKTNFTTDEMNNKMGYSDSDYEPIKWYRLNNKDKKFYVELYEKIFPTCPVVLPLDKRDDLIIEACLCLSSSDMI